MTISAALAAGGLPAQAGAEAVAPAEAAGTEPPRVVLDAAPVAWTAVRSGLAHSTAGFGFSADRFVGQCVGEGGQGCPADGVQRVAYDFGDLGEPAALQDGVLESASLTVPVGQDQSCGVQDMQVHAVPEVTDETTWASSVDTWSSASANTAEVGCGGDRDVEVDVTAAVRSLLHGDGPLALGLSAVDEDCRGCGRAALGPAATLTVELRMTDTVVPLGTLDPESECVVGEDRPDIRSTTPTLVASLSNDREPFPTSMRAVFSLRDLGAGDELWRSTATTEQGSGATHSRTVPADLLVHGGSYAWFAQAVLPSGNLTAPQGCEFTVDVQRPDEPVVTPAEGYAATYPEGEVSGGPGQTGGFVIDPVGSDDVVRFDYGFNGQPLTSVVAPGEVVEFTPTFAGRNYLSVRSVDDAGLVSTTMTYEFSVAFPEPSGAHWRFDELQGSTAANDLADSSALTLSGDLWGPGAFVEWTGDTTNGALVLTAPGDVATTDEPVVGTAGDLTVTAFVRPDGAGATAPIVTQGGADRIGFELGTTTGADCGTASGTCWAFSLGTGDGSTSETVVAEAGPEPGQWTFLAATRSAATGAVEILTCGAATGWWAESAGSRAIGGTTEEPGGALTIGGGTWQGSVDDVRVLEELTQDAQLTRWCQSAF